MLKFFRKIRQKLIDERNFQKYLIYAIGEILLVVIGILLALQINNINSQQKLKKLEISTLVELKDALEIDSMNLSNIIQRKRGYWSKIIILHDFLVAEDNYHEEWDALLVEPLKDIRVKLNIAAYNLLENRGIDLISDARLRKQIVSHYKIDQSDLLSRAENWLHYMNNFRDEYHDMLVPHADEVNGGYKDDMFSPLNAGDFVSNQKFHSQLKQRIYRINREVMIIKGFLDRTISMKDKVVLEIRKQT